MSPSRFYRLAVWAPLLLPVFAFPFIGGRHTEGPIPVLAPIAMLVMLAGTFGAIPYLGVAVPFSLWLRGKESRQIRRALLVAPLLIVASTAVFLVGVQWWGKQTFMDHVALTTWRDPALDAVVPWDALALASALVAILGYPYVGLVIWVGRRFERHSVEPPPNSAVQPTRACGPRG